MSDDEQLIMWSSQHKRVWDTIQKEGIYTVKQAYVQEKYEDVAWIFKEAYSYLNRKLTEKISQPEGAESPVWHFKEQKWALKDEDSVLLRLAIPVAEVVLFDLRVWNKVLNLTFAGSAEEEERFHRELANRGITDILEVHTTPYYPLQKKAVVDSWEKMFAIGGIEGQYIQGASWVIREEWIQEVIL